VASTVSHINSVLMCPTKKCVNFAVVSYNFQVSPVFVLTYIYFKILILHNLAHSQSLEIPWKKYSSFPCASFYDD